MVVRFALLLALAVVPLGAQDLVPRTLAVEWTGRPGSDPAFLAEVLRATLAQDAPYVVADPGDVADARLVLAAQGTLEVVATLTDSDPTRNWSKTLPVKAFTAAAVRNAVETLRPALAVALPPVPPQVREELVQKTVQEVRVDEKQKGLTVTLMGRPGTALTFADGSVLTVPESGQLALPEQVQYSSLAVTARLPGHFDRNATLPLADVDVSLDLTLAALPSWTVSLEPTASLFVIVQRRWGTESLFLEGSWESSWPLTLYSSTVSDGDTNALQLEVGSKLPTVHWAQPDVGVAWYGSRPDDFFVWGFDARAGFRFDFYPTGIELSRWFPFGLHLGAQVALQLAPWFSLGLNMGGRLVVLGGDPELLDTGSFDGYRPAVEVLGYRYQDTASNLQTLVRGALGLRSEASLELKFWF